MVIKMTKNQSYIKPITFLIQHIFVFSVCLQIVHAGQGEKLYVGETKYLEDSNISDVIVGNDAIVVAKPIRNRGIALTGVSAGDTTVKVWRGQRYTTADIHVYPSNLERTLSELGKALKDLPQLKLEIVGDNVIIQGDQLSLEQKEKVDSYALLFKNVINLTRSLESNTAEKQKMIYLDVRVIEISTSGTKEIGINWNTASIDGPKFGILGDFKKSKIFTNEDNPLSENISTFSKVTPFKTYLGLASFIDSRINLLQENGIAKVIARPLLSCKNGGKAAFLSGGQIPYQTVGATGTPSIEFKDYGIKLDIQPTISSEGITAKILAEVSSVDASVQAAGVPGLLTRRTDTEFVVGQGETLVLSGLVGVESGSGVSAVPGISSIPVLGHLFKTKANKIRKNELVFFVTPYVYENEFENKLNKISKITDDVVKEELGKNKILINDYNYNEEKNRN